jgi:hypothetical protein
MSGFDPGMAYPREQAERVSHLGLTSLEQALAGRAISPSVDEGSGTGAWLVRVSEGGVRVKVAWLVRVSEGGVRVKVATPGGEVSCVFLGLKSRGCPHPNAPCTNQFRAIVLLWARKPQTNSYAIVPRDQASNFQHRALVPEELSINFLEPESYRSKFQQEGFHHAIKNL